MSKMQLHIDTLLTFILMELLEIESARLAAKTPETLQIWQRFHIHWNNKTSEQESL